jgi:NAD(P)-dependent dehydrogenase (short-subunit alcohol dehydrogenase family)
MSGTLSGRVALITGAAGGIGSTIAEAFAEVGADLALLDMRSPESVAEKVQSAGRRVLACQTDVTSCAAIAEAVNRTVSVFGRLDILVNVAGVVSFGSAATLAEAEWDRVIAINLKGTFLACQAVIGPMRTQRFGRIINLGSVIGKNGGNARPWIDPEEQNRSSNVAYGVSKAGVHTLTFFLAKELAPDGITVNAIAPGPIASAMTTNLPPSLKALIPVGRMGEGRDVAAAALFLASEQAGFITGDIIDVNGGMWLIDLKEHPKR